MSANFPSEEKLKSRKRIQQLFKTGRNQFKHPLKLLYNVTSYKDSNRPAVQCAFSVPKRNFKRAVDRNKIKRLCKEAYRLNKAPLLEYYNNTDLQLDMMFVYIEREILDFQAIEKSIRQHLNKLCKAKSK